MSETKSAKDVLPDLLLESGQLASMGYAIADAMECSGNSAETYVPALIMLSHLLQEHYVNLDQYEQMITEGGAK